MPNKTPNPRELHQDFRLLLYLKFVYSEKATKVLRNLHLFLSTVHTDKGDIKFQQRTRNFIVLDFSILINQMAIK